ncbi:unnamed protein product [Vitrella brassicaformis CCMP3155]|uniref:Uncharacterized protein n=2 Tax=Vitrella brassicaformis TaxID=1169539 RepID=A0A0G4EDR5_VITBC|nr:unnamed protein product [Vitrella brassicaformis CCMP3155]|mmetsp:Transcript_24887/g.61551  ORF Transcript_24887/g.61551 Transcript_24887/m.61551 type:complete len:276 (+) Transcript_24887:421-1248(+)|eukprot:CEL93670.1 unnamed protein product [Vitrella brassicaformis CCMP3155]
MDVLFRYRSQRELWWFDVRGVTVEIPITVGGLRGTVFEQLRARGFPLHCGSNELTFPEDADLNDADDTAIVDFILQEYLSPDDGAVLVVEAPDGPRITRYFKLVWDTTTNIGLEDHQKNINAPTGGIFTLKFRDGANGSQLLYAIMDMRKEELRHTNEALVGYRDFIVGFGLPTTADTFGELGRDRDHPIIVTAPPPPMPAPPSPSLWQRCEDCMRSTFSSIFGFQQRSSSSEESATSEPLINQPANDVKALLMNRWSIDSRWIRRWFTGHRGMT